MVDKITWPPLNSVAVFVFFPENVCDQPVHGHGADPGERGREAGGDGGRRPHLGGRPRAGRGLHHLHRHRHPPLQKVSRWMRTQGRPF